MTPNDIFTLPSVPMDPQSIVGFYELINQTPEVADLRMFLELENVLLLEFYEFGL